jgi:prepilin-type N-terminal cleavage/methylation domain-containing protein
MQIKTNQYKGFTLIELLIVLAILSILTSILIPKLIQARAKTRDVSRFSTTKELEKAINMYYLDNGTFPNYPGNYTDNCSSGPGYNPTNWNTFMSSLSNHLTEPIPLDRAWPLCIFYVPKSLEPQCDGDSSAQYVLIFATEDKIFSGSIYIILKDKIVPRLVIVFI